MIGVLIVAIVFVSSVSFMFGYIRGMDELQTITNWGIGFDEGFVAGKEFAEGSEGEEISEVERENDRYNQEQDWLENHGRELE